MDHSRQDLTLDVFMLLKAVGDLQVSISNVIVDQMIHFGLASTHCRLALQIVGGKLLQNGASFASRAGGHCKS